MGTITISDAEFKEYQDLKGEVSTLRNTRLYIRLLECLENVKKKEYTRKDLGI